ncbi:microtubule-associated protein futsch isoform X1 [Lepisosteus oculatus]|uniref:microtubule-associated protein futsch isoform X1 n=1 Tax=Lepisosteus oculatus TaxID=7918 RepID=UPI0035F50D12
MSGLPPGDPKLVSMIVNHLKTQGLFDQFRRDCLADVDTKPAYLNLRQRVDNFVSNHLSNHTWSPHLNKNQLRNSIRQLVLQSGMLEAGVDRIVTQVVDPKIHHTFRPQVERVVCDFLGSINQKEEPPVCSVQAEEKQEYYIPTTGMSSVPNTSVASDAMSILDTITSLNQEASAAWASNDISAGKSGDRTVRRTISQPATDGGLEKEKSPDDAVGKEKLSGEVGDEEMCTAEEENLEAAMLEPQDAENTAEEPNEQMELSKETTEEFKEPSDDAEESKPDESKEKVNEKTKESMKGKDETAAKEKDGEAEQTPTDKHHIRQKARERLKEEYSLEDSDLEGLSDISVSSVHTSDLSCFEEESEEEPQLSDSTEEGEITSEDEEKVEHKAETALKDETIERKPRTGRQAYVHKPFLYSKYYSDSDDEVTVEQRRRSAAKDKEERLLKRQQNRERLEEKRKQKSAQLEHLDERNAVSPVCDPEGPSVKEALKEQKVLEKKVAISRKRKRDSRKDEDFGSSIKKKGDPEEESKETLKKTDGPEAMASSKELKAGPLKGQQLKPVRRLSESAASEEGRTEARRKKVVSSVSEDTVASGEAKEHKKVPDKNRTHSFILDLEQGSEELFKQRTAGKLEKHPKKEMGEADVESGRKREMKHSKERSDRERSLSDDRVKHKQKIDKAQKGAEGPIEYHGLESKGLEHLQKDGSSVSKPAVDDKSDRKSKGKTEKKSLSSVKESKLVISEVTLDESSSKDGTRKVKVSLSDSSKTEKVRSEKALTKCDSKQQLLLDSFSKLESSSEDKSDIEPVTDIGRKKEKHSKDITKRSKSYSDDRYMEKVKSKNENREAKPSERESMSSDRKSKVDQTLQDLKTEKSSLDVDTERRFRELDSGFKGKATAESDGESSSKLATGAQKDSTSKVKVEKSLVKSKSRDDSKVQSTSKVEKKSMSTEHKSKVPKPNRSDSSRERKREGSVKEERRSSEEKIHDKPKDETQAQESKDIKNIDKKCVKDFEKKKADETSIAQTWDEKTDDSEVKENVRQDRSRTPLNVAVAEDLSQFTHENVDADIEHTDVSELGKKHAPLDTNSLENETQPVSEQMDFPDGKSAEPEGITAVSDDTFDALSDVTPEPEVETQMQTCSPEHDSKEDETDSSKIELLEHRQTVLEPEMRVCPMEIGTENDALGDRENPKDEENVPTNVVSYPTVLSLETEDKDLATGQQQEMDNACEEEEKSSVVISAEENNPDLKSETKVELEGITQPETVETVQDISFEEADMKMKEAALTLLSMDSEITSQDLQATQTGFAVEISSPVPHNNDQQENSQAGNINILSDVQQLESTIGQGHHQSNEVCNKAVSSGEDVENKEDHKDKNIDTSIMAVDKTVGEADADCKDATKVSESVPEKKPAPETTCEGKLEVNNPIKEKVTPRRGRPPKALSAAVKKIVSSGGCSTEMPGDTDIGQRKVTPNDEEKATPAIDQEKVNQSQENPSDKKQKPDEDENISSQTILQVENKDTQEQRTGEHQSPENEAGKSTNQDREVAEDRKESEMKAASGESETAICKRRGRRRSKQASISVEDTSDPLVAAGEPHLKKRSDISVQEGEECEKSKEDTLVSEAELSVDAPEGFNPDDESKYEFLEAEEKDHVEEASGQSEEARGTRKGRKPKLARQTSKTSQKDEDEEKAQKPYTSGLDEDVDDKKPARRGRPSKKLTALSKEASKPLKKEEEEASDEQSETENKLDKAEGRTPRKGRQTGQKSTPVKDASKPLKSEKENKEQGLDNSEEEEKLEKVHEGERQKRRISQTALTPLGEISKRSKEEESPVQSTDQKSESEEETETVKEPKVLRRGRSSRNHAPPLKETRTSSQEVDEEEGENSEEKPAKIEKPPVRRGRRPAAQLKDANKGKEQKKDDDEKTENSSEEKQDEKDEEEKTPQRRPGRRGRKPKSQTSTPQQADKQSKDQSEEKEGEESSEADLKDDEEPDNEDKGAIKGKGKCPPKQSRGKPATKRKRAEENEDSDEGEPEEAEEKNAALMRRMPKRARDDSCSPLEDQEDGKGDENLHESKAENDEDKGKSLEKKVVRRGRPCKVIAAVSEEPEKQESDKKTKKTDEKEEEQVDEDDEDEEETQIRATTRSASRLEAERIDHQGVYSESNRNKPTKPSTRAFSKLSSPDPGSARDKRSSSGKEDTTSTTRSRTQLSPAAKLGRKPEVSPPAVRTRGGQRTEEPAAKRTKRT